MFQISNREDTNSSSNYILLKESKENIGIENYHIEIKKVLPSGSNNRCETAADRVNQHGR